MHDDDRKFRNGDIVFQEGEPSDGAFVLISGRVDLTKKSQSGEISLGSLGPGEMFGEMGAFDGSLRSTTARAQGDVVARLIPRDSFIDSLKSRPEAALAVMGKLGQRLRAAHEMLARGTAVPPPLASSSQAPPKARFLRRWLKTAERPRRLEVRVADLDGDPDGRQTTVIVSALSKRRDIRVRRLKETMGITAEGEGLIVQIAEKAATARLWLSKAKGDVMIWGTIPSPGPTVQLRFIPAEPENEDRPGCFGLILRLNLPVGFGPELGDVLAAVAHAAAMSGRERVDPALAVALSSAVEKTLPILQTMPDGLTTIERGSVALCLANAAAVLGVNGSPDLLHIAAHAYRQALRILKRDDASFDWGLGQRNLGMVLQSLAERIDDSKAFEEAATCYCEALSVLTKTVSPLLWATTQNRLGEVYCRIEVDDGDHERVKRALAAFQAAAQVVTRAERPALWAKIMHNFAQAALLLGELLQSPEALEGAISAAKNAIEVRIGQPNLLSWAASQNTLGSALFLLGKQTRDKALLAQAVAAFRQAEDIYRSQGTARMVAVTEKNLARAADLLESIAPSRVPRMRWESEA